MDFGDPSPGDDFKRLERKVNRLTVLSITQTVFLAIAVLMYVVSLASTYMFWIALVLIVGLVAWAVRDKSPNWLKTIGNFLMKLMRTRTERTSVTASNSDSNSDSSPNETMPMAG